jgi:F-type H+-transporting ATPase subunit gamma
LATQRDIKRRIESVRNTRKITRAMELVASAKLRRAQEQIESLRPYATAMQRIMSQAARQSGSLPSFPLLEERAQINRAAVVAITGDRGLAGAFNVNIIRGAGIAARELSEAGAGEVIYTAVGKKGAGTLNFRRLTIDRVFQGFSTAPTYADAQHVAEHLVQAFTAGEVDRVVIVYNAFKSVLEQRVVTEQLLPIDRSIIPDEDDFEREDEAEHGGERRGLAIFEPEPEAFIERLLPTYVDTAIFRALLESAAAELAARRTAMRNATDNAGSLIDDLTLAMNRARQAAITQEILEVVAGADALS